MTARDTIQVHVIKRAIDRAHEAAQYVQVRHPGLILTVSPSLGKPPRQRFRIVVRFGLLGYGVILDSCRLNADETLATMILDLQSMARDVIAAKPADAALAREAHFKMTDRPRHHLGVRQHARG
jgi:hypothetical protein